MAPRRARTLDRLFVAVIAFLIVFGVRLPAPTAALGDPPVANDDAFQTREGKAVDVFLDASDNEFDPLTFEVVDPPTDGTLDPVECDGGSCTYTPNAGFAGTDSFTWKANDGLADSNIATATIVVNSNTAPFASDDSGATREGKPLPIFLFANDDDFDELTYTIVSEPSHGTLVCEDGACTYSPDTGPNYIGEDSFTWKANDGLADSNVATFSIAVVANTGPEAFDQSGVARQSTDEFIFLLTHDEDFDELSHVIVDPPEHGTLSDCSSGSCIYSPDAAYVGLDSFTWRANDGLADSNVATFSIEVVANTAPVAVDGSLFVFTDTSAPARMSATDNEDDPLSFTIVAGPDHGDLTECFDASCTYTPDLGYVGPDSFTWTANDGQVDSNVATTQITVGEPIGRVLILEPTVTGGGDSREAQAAALKGYAADVVDEATWGAMTAEQFDSYAAIVLGDPTCSSIESVAAAEANRATWSSVVDGNVVVIGTDPIFHEDQGGGQLTDSAMAYVLASTDKTGLFAGLSCYYDGAEDNTPVPLLDAFGTFEVGHADCFNDAHIVAEHPALSGLDDGDLSDWSCSVHEVFQDWPLSFIVLTIAENFGSVYTATDGTVGSPYILAAGDIDVASDIDLTPLTATNPVGTSHEVTASVSDDNGPVVGTAVTFTVIDGPHSGTTGSDTTDSAGQATFSYLGTTLGTDTIKATFVDAEDRTQTSNLVTKTWEAAGNAPPSVEAGGPYGGEEGDDEGSDIGLDGTVTDADAGDTVTTAWSYDAVGVDEGASCSFAAAGAVDTTVSCTDDGSYTLTLTADDGVNSEVLDTATLTLANAAPTVAISAPAEGSDHDVDETINLAADVDDPGANDTLSCFIEWGDSTGEPGGVDAGVCTGSHSYAEPGPYTITVTASDDEEADGSDTVAITLSDGPNSPPDAIDDEATTNEARPVTIDVLTNDADDDTDSLSITASTDPEHGTADCDSGFECVYTPDAGFFGVDSFEYTVSDGEFTDTATVAVTVEACPDLTEAIDGAGIVTDQTWIACSAVDAHAATTIHPDHMTIDGSTAGLLTSGTAAGIDADPSELNARSNGLDLRGAHDVSILRLDLAIPAGATCLSFNLVFGSEEYPEFVGQFNDAFIAELDVSDWSVAGNDITAPNNFAFDPNGGVVSVNSTFFDESTVVTDSGTVYDGSTGVLEVRSPVTAGAHQLYLSIFDAGDETLDSGAFVDQLVAFDDAGGGCEAGANQPPTATPDTATVDEDSSDNVLDVLANDDDPDTDALAIAAITTDPEHGTATVDTLNDTILYSPDADYNGPDSLTYRISDGRGGSATTTVSITVLPINDVPSASDDTVVVAQDDAASVDLGARVSDVETTDANLAYEIVAQPLHGELTGSGPTFTYTPDAGYSGPDSFTYRVMDRGDRDACIGDPPTCDDPATSTIQTISITVTATTFILDVNLAGGGSGGVTSDPAGIACPADCSEAYGDGTGVTLTADPGEGSVFAGWSGEGCTGTGTCVVTMDAARSVTATFVLDLPTFTVNTVSDTDDGACTIANCSLREAIDASNDTEGTDAISFDIPGAGPHTIALTSALPTITDAVVIDGTTEPGFEDCSSGTLIEINGASAGTAPGLNITGGGTTIRGLAIFGFTSGANQPGIQLATLGGNVIECNLVGTDASGTTAIPNDWGIRVTSAGNQIGSPGAGNVISGNTGIGLEIEGVATATANVVQSNLIGLDITGAAALGNGSWGIGLFTPSNTIGGSDAGEGNTIAANGSTGISLQSGGNAIVGNRIGTDVQGLDAVPNWIGIEVWGDDNTIGGSGALGNLISGNELDGVIVRAGATETIIQGNVIGLDATGLAKLANRSGVWIDGAAQALVGGETGNLISGNTAGVLIQDATATANAIVGNDLGPAADGSSGVGNGIAIIAESGAHDNLIGGVAGGNVIAFNGSGVLVSGDDSTHNAILGNAIHANGSLGIDLIPPTPTSGVTANDPDDADSGANDLQNFPVLTSAVSDSGDTTVEGTLDSGPTTTFIVELFTNDACDPSLHGEGQTFVESIQVTTDANGDGTFSTSIGGVPVGAVVTATATNPGGNTSEFSACRTVTDPLPDSFTLDVTLAGDGFGSVTSDPAGIDCPGDCTDPYDDGALVTLTATPDEGSTFAGWTGDCTGSASCVVTMDQARSVTATFDPLPDSFTLDVTLAGDGFGSVTSDPAGIDCPGDCTDPYDDGALVTLTATPDEGSTFAGWTGDCTGSASCVVTMDQARSVTATFDPPPSADLSVTKTDEPDPVTAGNAIHYVLTVTNSGPDSATGIALEDTLPAGTTFVEVDDSGCAHVNGVVTCTIASLSAEDSVEISIVVRAPNVTAETVITNSVTVSGDQDDPNPLNDGSTEDTTVQPPAADPDTASGWITGAGGTIATNAGKPPTKKDPMTTSVTVPAGFPGMVIIKESAIGTTCPVVICFGQKAEIAAPTTTAEEPLVIVFSYHPGSLPPGSQLDEITMFHDGIRVERCDDDSGIAEPDPCILAVARAKGAVTVTVLTSENGSWIGGR